MATLSSGFERALEAEVLDQFDTQAFAEYVAEEVRSRMWEYGTEYGYDLSNLIEAVRGEVLSDGRVRVVIPDPGALFEHGTVDHHVPGDDILSFVWERRHDPPEWVREEYEREGNGWRVFLPETTVEGLPEGRFIRDTKNELERMFNA